MADQIITVKLLLAIIIALSSLQIIIFGYFIRKYINRFEVTESTVSQLKTEHCMIQKEKTGMK